MRLDYIYHVVHDGGARPVRQWRRWIELNLTDMWWMGSPNPAHRQTRCSNSDSIDRLGINPVRYLMGLEHPHIFVGNIHLFLKRVQCSIHGVHGIVEPVSTLSSSSTCSSNFVSTYLGTILQQTCLHPNVVVAESSTFVQVTVIGCWWSFDAESGF